MQEMPQEPIQPVQDNVTPKDKTRPKYAVNKLSIILAVVVLVVGITICLAVFAFMNNGSTSNQGSQTPTASTPQSDTPQTTNPPASQTPPPSTVPEITVTPAPPTTPSNPPETPAQETPSQPSTPSAGSVSSDVVIKSQAYQMVLTLSDMGKGWTFSSASSPQKKFVASSSHINFTKGSYMAPVVQNMTYVFRSIDVAKSIYEEERQLYLSDTGFSNPAIGDECFLNEKDLSNKVLVFRENNVVVWIYLQQWEAGDPVEYARIVSSRIVE